MTTLPLTLEDRASLLQARYAALYNALHTYRDDPRYATDFKNGTEMMGKIQLEQTKVRIQMLDQESYNYELSEATSQAEKLLFILAKDNNPKGWSLW